MRLFHKERAYDAFERVLSEGLGRYSVDMLTYCLMPDHWHLVVCPRTDEALGQLTGWVGVTHVRGHQEHYHRRGAGHLYQGRYKSFPVAEDDYFLMLCRYVEANPAHAKLVERAEEWKWCGFWRRVNIGADLPLCRWPVERPRNWTRLVKGGLAPEELRTVRQCLARGRPLGRCLGCRRPPRGWGWVSPSATQGGPPRISIISDAPLSLPKHRVPPQT